MAYTYKDYMTFSREEICAGKSSRIKFQHKYVDDKIEGYCASERRYEQERAPGLITSTKINHDDQQRRDMSRQ